MTDSAAASVSSPDAPVSAFAEAFSEPMQNLDEQVAAQTFWEKYVHQPPLRLFLAGILAGGAAVTVLWLLMHFLIFKKAVPQTVSVQVKESDTAALRQLKEACQSGPAEKVKQALLNWGRSFWPDKPPLTVSELAERMNSPALKLEIDELNRALYGEDRTEWSGEDFWLAFKTAATDGKKKAENEKIPVPPLYPD